MNKHEQERKIEQLRELKAQLQRHGSGSQEPMPEIEAPAAAESSESSDSEEEWRSICTPKKIPSRV